MKQIQFTVPCEEFRKALAMVDRLSNPNASLYIIIDNNSRIGTVHGDEVVGWEMTDVKFTEEARIRIPKAMATAFSRAIRNFGKGQLFCEIKHNNLAVHSTDSSGDSWVMSFPIVESRSIALPCVFSFEVLFNISGPGLRLALKNATVPSSKGIRDTAIKNEWNQSTIQFKDGRMSFSSSNGFQYCERIIDGDFTEMDDLSYSTDSEVLKRAFSSPMLQCKAIGFIYGEWTGLVAGPVYIARKRNKTSGALFATFLKQVSATRLHQEYCIIQISKKSIVDTIKSLERELPTPIQAIRVSFHHDRLHLAVRDIPNSAVLLNGEILGSNKYGVLSETVAATIDLSSPTFICSDKYLNPQVFLSALRLLSTDYITMIIRPNSELIEIQDYTGGTVVIHAVPEGVSHG